MLSSSDKDFGTLRSLFWPIYSHEVRKIMPMLLMVFLVCFNYSALRNLKDAVVITASGAEVLPFLKVWGILPAAVLVTYLFAKLSDIFSQERVFYIIIGCFVAFFLLFAFVLYPQGDALNLDTFSNFLERKLPAGFHGLIEMIRRWTLSGFYIVCELWSSLVLSVLFWGFANEITKLHEARRFYSVLQISSNFAAIVAGLLGSYVSHIDDLWESNVKLIVSLVGLSGIATIFIFRWMNKNVLNDPEFDELHNTKRELKKKKKRLSMRESFSFLSQSKYLLCIAVLVVGYNLVINLVEVVWKDQVKHVFPKASDFNAYMNDLTVLTGLISTIMALFISRIIQRYGWTFAALITPVTMFITSIGFFGCIFFQKQVPGAGMAFMGLSPIVIAIYIGGMQNSLSKAAKYSVFDATKEMAFIPLDHEVKLKGKAAIDGVGSRFGKFGGSLIYQGLLMLFVTVSSCTPYVAVILLMMIGLWIVATRSLGGQFETLVQDQEERAAAKIAAKEEAKPVTVQ